MYTNRIHRWGCGKRGIPFLLLRERLLDPWNLCRSSYRREAEPHGAILHETWPGMEKKRMLPAFPRISRVFLCLDAARKVGQSPTNASNCLQLPRVASAAKAAMADKKRR